MSSGQLKLSPAELTLSSGQLNLSSAELTLSSEQLNLSSADLKLRHGHVKLRSADLKLRCGHLKLRSADLKLRCGHVKLRSADLKLRHGHVKLRSAESTLRSGHVSVIVDDLNPELAGAEPAITRPERPGGAVAVAGRHRAGATARTPASGADHRRSATGHRPARRAQALLRHPPPRAHDSRTACRSCRATGTFSTTMIYAHVPRHGARGVRSPSTRHESHNTGTLADVARALSRINGAHAAFQLK